MKTKDINTLAQLRQAKKDLKLNMKRADQDISGNFIYSTINNLLSGKNKKHTSPILDEGTLNAINFVAAEEKKIKVGKVPALILSVAAAIAVPILTKKVIKKLKKT